MQVNHFYICAFIFVFSDFIVLFQASDLLTFHKFFAPLTSGTKHVVYADS